FIGDLLHQDNDLHKRFNAGISPAGLAAFCRRLRPGPIQVQPPRWRSYNKRLFSEALKYQTSIRSAEPEAVCKNIFDLGMARCIRYIIEVAIRIRKFVIDSRRELIFMQRHNGKYCLDTAGRAE